MKKVEIIFQPSAEISTAITELRKKLGFTQFEMANALGVRERNVQRWESGDAVPGGDLLIRVLQMCPDAECLALFGLRAAPGLGRTKSESPHEIGTSKLGTETKGIRSAKTALPVRVPGKR